MNRQPADLLIILTHHVGELDAFFPLIFLLRESRSSWRTKVLVTKKTMIIQIRQSPALLAMMASLEIDYHFVPVNASNEPAELHAPGEMKPQEGRKWLSRVAGRLCSYILMARSIPKLLRELSMHKVISVEGTQYSLLISLTCLFANLCKRDLFLHNHSVQSILSLPLEKKRIFGKRYAKGIVFSDTNLSRNLYGEELFEKTYRTGLLKYLPAWTAFCRRGVISKDSKTLGIFTKRINFGVYRKLLENLLLHLVQAKYVFPILIKPHPMDKLGAYNELIVAYPALQLTLTNEPNFSLMPILHAGICFPGSSILDCDAFKVPAIELRPVTKKFDLRKVVTTDYADSGYLSTSDIGYVVEWLTTTSKQRLPDEGISISSCGENELDALIVALQASTEPTLER